MKGDSCLRLYYLLQEQKKFEDKIILKIDMVDTCKFHWHYYIPINVELLIGTNVDALTELVEPHLICKPADVFTLHFIALDVLSKELNVKNIGVYVDEEIENRVNELLQRRRQLEEMRFVSSRTPTCGIDIKI